MYIMQAGADSYLNHPTVKRRTPLASGWLRFSLTEILLLIAVLLIAMAASNAASAATIATTKACYDAGETITVNYDLSGYTPSSSDWVAFYDAGTNLDNSGYIDWDYTTDFSASGSMVFGSGLSAGSYDVRMIIPSYTSVASFTFVVLDDDIDSDGIPNSIDVDDDNDGILDTIEGDCVDTDGDGIPDRADIDSDNDGIADVDEGQAGSLRASGVDTDGDGLDNSFEAAGLPATSQDSDGDTTPDWRDFDPSFSQSLCGAEPLVLTYHATLASTKDGFYVWGGDVGPLGENVLSPLAVTPENGFDYTGIPLLATQGGNGYPQFFLLSSEGLYVWGGTQKVSFLEGVVIPHSLTSSDDFQQIAMPVGVVPSDVKLMTASGEGRDHYGGALVLLTNSGDVYVLGLDPNLYGDGSLVADSEWHQAAISNVDQLVLGTQIFAVTSTNEYYTWGSAIYDGTGAAATASSTPVLMTAPFAGTPVSITADGNAYYVLAPDGRVWVLGENGSGELGIGSSSDQTTWTTMRNSTDDGDMTDVVYLAAGSHDPYWQGASVITADGSLYVMGNSELGLGLPFGSGNITLPTAPTGVSSATHNPLSVAVGGHSAAFIDANTSKYCYAGHRIEGSMGDGTGDNVYEDEFNCELTAVLPTLCSGAYDYGDSPASYNEDDAPNHAISITPELYLGVNNPDQEAIPAPGAAATGDGDDEDGVSSFPVITTGASTYTVPVSLTNTTGATATVCGWIDLDLNGTFDTDEQTCNTAVNGATLSNLVFDVSAFVGNEGDGDPTNDLSATADYYSRFRICSTASECNVLTGAASDGEVEDYVLPIDTLPVTLSHFGSTRIGNKVDVDWGTSSELFNVGFQLWGLDGGDGQWTKLHNWLVKSGSGNAVEPQSYRKTARLPNSIEQLTAIGISSVDSDGTEHYYGPFEVGTSYGDLASLEPIKWNHIRAQTDTNMASQGYIKDRVNGYRKAGVDSQAALTGDTQTLAQFNVSEDGMYRITVSELLNAGVDMRRVAKRDLAVVDHLGEPVVRDVIARGKGKGPNKTLGDKGELYIYAKAPDVRAGLYTTASVYRIIEDSELAREALVQGKQGLDTGFSTQYREQSYIEEDRLYVLQSAADDPWLHSVVLSYPDQPRGAVDYIDLPGDTIMDEGVEIIIGAARSSALGGSGVEHLMQGAVIDANGQIVWLDTREAVGKGLWEQRFAVPPGTALGDANGQVGVGALFSAGAGYAFSEVHMDYVGLSYVRPTTAKEGEDYLHFDGATEAPGYEVIVPNTGTLQVFAHNGSTLVRIVPESDTRLKSTDGTKQRRVEFAALPGSGDDPSIHYWVGSSSAAMSVEGLYGKSIVSQDALLAQAGGSDLLLIVHPAFMGADENGVDSVLSYAQFKQSQGVSTAVLNYLDIVDTFGGGQSGPHGLTAYLHQLEGHFGVDNVLIVGGSTYDHMDILGIGAITFIPGHYGQSNYSNYTVSDVPYITDNEGNLFANIGRWPVRTMDDLDHIVNKSLVWSQSDHTNGETLLIAENTLAGENINFGAALDSVAGTFPSGWTTNKVYVDEILAANPGYTQTQALTQARSEIVGHLNAVPELVLFNGHADTRQLSNNGLFKSSHIAQVTEPGAEVWVPLSCYVTYYESTHVNTLAHQLLFTGNAVNITGAMLLSDQAGNIAMGAAILSGMMTDNTALGEAVNAAKAIQNNPQLTINWALLGDPTIRP